MSGIDDVVDDEIKIRVGRVEDLEQITAMFDAFSDEIGLDPFVFRAESSHRDSFSLDPFFVAVCGSTIVGLGFYHSLKGTTITEPYNTLAVLSHPEVRDVEVEIHEDFLSRSKIYDNPYTDGTHTASDGDFFVSYVLVSPDYRRGGAASVQNVGNRIAQAILEEARRQGATHVYTNCWSKSRSVALCTGLGFTSMALERRHYANGDDTIWMGGRVADLAKDI